MFNCTMRVVLGLLLVLLGLCGSAAQQDGFTKVGEIGEFPETAARDTADESIEDTTKQTRHDIWAELRALKDTVSDVRVELYLLQRDNADLQTRLSSGERELLVSKFRVDLLEKENADLQTRLSSSESELLVSKFRIDQVEKENAVQETRLNATESQTSGLEGEITDLQTRLSSSESELLFSKSRIDQLGKENAVQETRLNATEIQTSGLKGKITVQETRLNTTEIQTSGLEGEITDLQTRLSSSQSELLVSESRIDQLEKENAEKPKVAFYTALTDAGQVGPYNADVTLKYSKVFTNIGNAYSPSTGFFTAPVKGAYYLQFTAASYRTGYMGVQVFKNNQRIMFNGEFMDGSAYKYLTNSVVLELIAGDEVHLVLPPNNYLQDTSDNHNTFSGALLFPL
uniref:major antigen-like isoform X9 n=1 Tax=Gasterosteus aculeatus aculeatus TaxID=481459 RepID=UPI001A99D29F|nr:major antigen-like isoform X9 [Gasterosteus aculeatus aculeatus]